MPVGAARPCRPDRRTCSVRGSVPRPVAARRDAGSGVVARRPAWQWFVPAVYLLTIASEVADLRGGTRTASVGAPAGHGRGSDRRGPAAAVADRRGDRRFGAGTALLGLQPGLLLGSGLFDRVHVADRVAYLCALSDMREGAGARKLEIRLRAPRASAEESDEKYSDFALELADTGDPSEPVMAVLRENGEIGGAACPACRSPRRRRPGRDRQEPVPRRGQP